MASLGTAFLQVKGDFGPLRAGLRRSQTEYGKQVDGMGKRLSQGFKNAALAGGAALLAGAAVGAKKSVDAAVDLGEQINKTNVVFRGSEKQIQRWSKGTATALGISQRAALESAGVFGNMLVPMGFARKEAGKMSRRMVDLAADMASFNNASPEETLDALRAGLAGETEPLRRYGVFLNEARIEAEAMSLGLLKTTKNTDAVKAAQLKAEAAQSRYNEAVKKHGKDSREAKTAQAAMITSQGALEKATKGTTEKLTAQQKAAATYSIILKDTKDSQGDFANTSDSLANKQRQLKAQLEDIAASLGKALLPALQKGAGALSDFAGDVSKILNRKDLSAGEKFDRIGEEIAERLEAALPVVADAAGKIAPKVALAFVKGFIQAPPLVQLVAGTWLFAKSAKLLQAFGLLGTQAGFAFGTGVGAGAAGGAGGGAAAGGLAGVAARLRTVLPRLGFIGVGVTAADLILKNLNARMDAGSKNLTDRLKGLTATPELDFIAKVPGGGAALSQAIKPLFTSDDQRRAERLKAILGQLQTSRKGITAEAANEASQLARNLDLTRQQRLEIQRMLDAGRAKNAPGAGLTGITAELEKTGRITPGIINNISAQLEDLPRKTRPKFAQAVLDWARELKKDGKIKGNLQQLKAVITAEVDGVGRLSVKGPSRLRQRVAAGFEAMVGAVADPTSRMAQIVQSYLDAFGASGIDKISGAIAKDKAVRKNKRGPGGIGPGLAQGGFLEGKGRKDTIPIMAAPGEAVLNRHQQAPVETALRSTYGYGLGDLFKKERRPHFMARGGFAGKQQGIVSIPGQPGESIHASILQDVLSLIRRYKLKVTDGYAPSGHAAGGEHPKGLAIDAVPGAGGSWDLVDKLAKWAEPTQNNPRAPFRWVGYTGDSGHGRGNHLHLSWGGGGGGIAADVPDLGRIKISGDGVTHDLGQAAADKVRKAAQSFLEKQTAAPVGTSTDPGGGDSAANKRLARSLMKGIFPASEFGALEQLWQGESGWDENAVNRASGAGGIPQALPASKMGDGWQGNARQQIAWGLRYIKQRYGSPSAALAAWKSRSPHWYAGGGFVESLREMYAGGFTGPDPVFRADTKDKKSTKPKGVKKPPKGGPSPGPGFVYDADKYKWVKRRRKGKGNPFGIPALESLRKSLDVTIPTIQDRIEAMTTTFGITEEEHYPDERAVPRLQREGHNIEKIGDSFIDWTAVEQSKSELGQLLGQGLSLIGTPFGASKGVMEVVKDSFPVVINRVDEVFGRLKNEIQRIKNEVRENLKEMRRREKEIDQLDEKLSKERDRKKPDKAKLARWNREKDDHQNRVNRLRRENRRLTGESDPNGDLSGVDRGLLGERNTRYEQIKEDREALRDDKTTFIGASGIGGDFGSQKADISRLVADLGEISTERIREAVAPVGRSATNADIQSFLNSIGDLTKQFGTNFRPLRRQRGGLIPGFGDGDKIPVLAEPGEAFINKKAVAALGGSKEIERINRTFPRFQNGGVVASPIQSFATGGVVESQTVTTQPDDSLLKALARIEKALEKTTVEKNIDARSYFKEVPANPHAFSRAVKFELEAAV